MPKISIIVPVYNVEKYLKRCVDSILNQTFKDFELILVDDGSTDTSGEICDEYSGIDNRVVVVHKKNGGLSNARNNGIDMASGEYLGFIDSDDYIEKDMYEVLYNDITKNNADIAICGMYDVYGGVPIENKNTIDKCVLDNITAFKLTLESKILSVSAVNKLYKKSLFKELRYPEGKTYEDAYLTPIILFNSQKIAYNPLPKYYYVHGENSITTNAFKMSDLGVIEAYKKHLEFVRKNIPDLEEQAMFRYLWAHMIIFDKIIRTENFNNDEIYQNVLKVLKSNVSTILKNRLFSYKRKISMLILIISPKLYKKFLLKDMKKKFNKIEKHEKN